MILQRLVEYYDRMASEPARNIATFGFSRERVDFCLVLNPQGARPAINDLRAPGRAAERVGPRMLVPHHGEKRTANDRPFFLSDGTDYVLGAGGDPLRNKRDLRRFDLFRREHLELEIAVNAPEYSLFCRFLEGWNPELAREMQYWDDGLPGSRLAVKVQGVPGYLHELDACRKAWVDKLCAATGVPIDCLINGQPAIPARVHQAIKGIRDPGGQAEKSIVSFNKDKTAFESYGKTQGENAPIAVFDAFRYTTALNELLDQRHRRLALGDATVVVWAEHQCALEDYASEIFGDVASAPGLTPIENKRRTEQVRLFLSQLRDGHAGNEAVDANDSTRFYVLGLSPSASRISVRFWADSTVEEMKARLIQHMEDTELASGATQWPMTVRTMVTATARLDKGKLVYDSISPHLAGDVARAILSGTSYPRQLLSAVLSRIHGDGVIDHHRAATAKACVIRNSNVEVPVALNPQHFSPSYHCGRLLALLDYAQAMALGNVNAGIIKKFYGSASMQPSAVFGRLIAAATKAHIPKLDPGLRQFVDREMQQITAMIGDSFPTVLSLEEQGMFAIGFYQEKMELPQTPPTYRHESERGEQVRSKSEVIIANMLHAMGINYEYEVPLAITGSRPIRPDFTVVGESPPATIYIEHLGMLEDESYRQKWEVKQAKFREAGILPWSEGGGPNGKLITTAESKERGLDSAAIRELFGRVFVPPA